MQLIYVVCGQSGTGKSTVLSRVSERRDVTVVNFGEAIFDLAKESGLVKERDDISVLGPETLAELQMQASEHVKHLQGKIIIDMHLTIRTRAGFVAGMPKKVMEMLSPHRIILLEEEPYEVLKRRMVGKEMKKADDSLADIQEHADIDRAAAVSIAIGVGAPVKIIKNDDTEKTASFIIGLLDED